MNIFRKLRLFCIYFLPVTLFFSYYPLISLGETDSMHLELSLPLIWLVLFSLISAPMIMRNFNLLIKKNKKFFFSSTICLFFISCSLFWTTNPLRGFLTSGILWFILFSVFSFIDFFTIDENVVNFTTFKQNFIKIFFISTTVICLFCWFQCLLDVFGIDRETTLLCLGCTYKTFGFPHPSGFAIEPQFMGNILLAPTLLAFYFFIKQSQKKYLLLFAFFSATLFIVFSRGAIYAFIVAFLIFIIHEFRTKTSLRKIILQIFTVFSAFLFALFSQGIFSTLSNTNDTFFSGIDKSINQLSLGIIDLNFTQKETSIGEKIDTDTNQTEPEKSIFDGYVEESTNTRLNLSEFALYAWLKSPTSFFFGYGIGSAGTAMHGLFPEQINQKEIIQNEPLAILVELGFVGAATIIIVLIFIIKALKKSDKIFFIALGGAYFITLLFFSGLPNALHIYLLPPLLFFLIPKNNSVITNKIQNHNHERHKTKHSRTDNKIIRKRQMQKA